MARSKKAVTIYGLQALLAVIIVAAGIAKLSGADLMVQSLQMLGVGRGALAGIGAVEIIAGLYLLLPRGGMVGAMLLGCVMLGTLGVTLGHHAPQQRSVVPLLLEHPEFRVVQERDV